MTTAELMMGAAELNRRALLEKMTAGAAMAGVQADVARPRTEWVDPRTPAIAAGSTALSTFGFSVRG